MHKALTYSFAMTLLASTALVSSPVSSQLIGGETNTGANTGIGGDVNSSASSLGRSVNTDTSIENNVTGSGALATKKEDAATIEIGKRADVTAKAEGSVTSDDDQMSQNGSVSDQSNLSMRGKTDARGSIQIEETRRLNLAQLEKSRAVNRYNDQVQSENRQGPGSDAQMMPSAEINTNAGAQAAGGMLATRPQPISPNVPPATP
jgi:hypothetical protein